MFKKINLIEQSFVFSVVLLLIIGVVAIVSVSTIPAHEKLGTPYYYIIRHIVYIIIGICSICLISKINLNLIKKYSLFLLLANVSLLALVLKFGFSTGGATRWIAIGPFTAQPSEFLKLTFLIYFCSWLSKITKIKNKKKRKTDNSFSKGLLICIFFFISSAFFLIKQPDFSNLIILFFILMVVYFLSETPFWHSILVSLVGSAGFLTLIKLAPYRLERLQVFFNNNTDPMGMGYQMKQISIAIGSGGLFGLGLGMSRQKLGFLPEPMTDAIFAVFCEEAGFIGGGLIIILFFIFLWAGLTISKNSSDKFSLLLGAGIVFWIMFQALINMTAMLGIIPLTGVPLPFISYGGSHIITELVAVGLLLNISRKSKIK